MKMNLPFKTRCTAEVFSSLYVITLLCCITLFASPALAQSSPAASKQSKAQQADTTFKPASLSAPIAKNPLAKLAQTDPSDLLNGGTDKTSVAPMTDYSNRQNRATELDHFSWQAANLHHRRLFFEDVEIERRAVDRRAGNLAAGFHFFKSLVQLPMRLVTGK